MTFSDIIEFGVIVLLSLSLLMAFIRLCKGPTFPDRVVALDLMATTSIGIIVLIAIATDLATLLDVATVIALTSFLGTIAFAYYIEQRKRTEKND